MIKGALRLTKCFALSDLRNRVAFAQRVQVPRPGERAGLYDFKKIQPVVEKKIQPEVEATSAKPQAASNA